MKRLATILAITIGTLVLMMLIVVSADAKTVTKVRPVVGVGGPVTVDVWTDRAEGSVYNRGESIAIYFYASADCYVTIYDIDTDGRVKILFPEYPDDGFVFGGMTYRLPEYYRQGSLFVNGSRGIEYIRAVATRTPGAFRYQTYGGRYHIGIDPITGDPFQAMNSINGRIISSTLVASTATTWFFVDGRVWYPRYMCNSCHGATVRFDPYRDACPRYSVHVAGGYDYWWNYSYYPKVSVHFRFGGPFWSFALRTGPYHRHRHIRYIDVAYGYDNYYCPKPPRRPFRHIPHTTSRTYVRRDRVKSYNPVTYGEIRTRRERKDPRTRDYTGASSRTNEVRSTRTSRTPSSQVRSRETAVRNGSSSVRPSSSSRSSSTRSSSTRTSRTVQTITPTMRSRTNERIGSATRSGNTSSSVSRLTDARNRTTTTERTSRTAQPITRQNSTQQAPSKSPARTETQTRSRTREIQTSRIPSAPRSKAIPSRSSSSSRSPGSESRSRQQSSSSSSSRSSTRTR